LETNYNTNSFRAFLVRRYIKNMDTLKEALAFLNSAPYLLKKEYRTSDGKAWKVSFEGDRDHIDIQIGDSACVSIGTISRNMIDNTVTFWAKNLKGDDVATYNAILDIVENITANCSINTVGYEWEKRLNDMGFYGSKVQLHFLKPTHTAYSRKAKSIHNVYLFKNAGGLHYSQRNRSGYKLEGDLKDNLIAITKI
jgi:hypothetical protein